MRGIYCTAAFIIILPTLVQFVYSFSASTRTKTPSLVDNLIHLHPDSANNVLCNLLGEEDDTLVRLTGLVSTRRAIGKHLIFLDIIPMEIPNVDNHNSKKNTIYDDIESIVPVQAILRRDFWNNLDINNNTVSSSSYDVYHKIIQPGVHVQLIGHAGPSRNAKEAILFLHSANYTCPNDNPQHLRNVLRYVKEGELDINEVADALPFISSEELADTIGLGNHETNYTFGEMAVKILSNVPRNYLCNPSKLMGSNNSQKVKLLPPAPPEYMKPPLFCINQNKDGCDIDDEVVSISNALKQHQNQMNDEQCKQFTITGWVQNRRRYKGSISVVELVDEFQSIASVNMDSDTEVSSDNETKAQNSKLKDLWRKRIHAILHPGALDNSDRANSTEISETYGNILCSGARVLLQGYLSPSDSSTSGAPVFWVTSCRLLRSSWRLGAVRQVLDLLHGGKIAVEEAANALELPGGYSQAEDIARGTTSTTERQWMAAELTQSLQGENSRIGKITSSMSESLSFFAHARERYPVEKISLDSGSSGTLGTTSSLRKSPDGSRFQRAKKPQLKLMIEEIAKVLRSHPEYGTRKLKVVDIGGGRGLLSNFLAETFGHDMVEVQVVDISRSATNNGMMRARRRGLKNVEYTALDATTLNVTGVDVVVALHACGALTDVALGHAVCQGAGFVICPCCFRSNPHLRVSIPSKDDYDSSAELVTAEEWLAVEHAQYGHLKQLAELQGDIKLASEAMHTICGLRALAVDRLWQNKRWPSAELDISIKAFPIGLSTRNLCLIGKFNNK